MMKTEKDTKAIGRKSRRSWVICDMKTGKKMEFSDFLKDLRLSPEDYILAVRSSLSCTSPRIMRQVKENRVKTYNKFLLRCWRTNIDIQIMLDSYSCARYIVTYISKSQKGISNLYSIRLQKMLEKATYRSESKSNP